MMTQIFTERLILMTCPLDMAKSIVLNRDELLARSPIFIPDEWPSLELRGLLPFYIEKLENNSEKENKHIKWDIWLIIDYKDKAIIGTAILKEDRNEEESVELGYHIIPAYREKGFGFEAAQALVDWAFLNDGINKITAECVDTNFGSIRILEKLGMCCIDKDDRFLLWELKKAI
ncbi:GNAT family N-acetyltransferase [Bacillus sp. Marseille-P3661]|uniref:GNAT family N-acetyltransferase n=1 Tax=Bacillus sp. Marseille-P3661 TaxID=1936234 RepID=UPI0015E19A56|nr:GNAT family N-acetyltransferase [Bacillus sp. Marseille-P3661]